MMMSKNRNFTAISYPRTGKRGVPQQFPRRLYEMLEIESSAAATSNRCQPKKPPECSPDGDGVPLISWSETGRAFRITDVSAFAEKILPNYFRTSKFSSFQRNLNLVSTLLHGVGIGCGGKRYRRSQLADNATHTCGRKERNLIGQISVTRMLMSFTENRVVEELVSIFCILYSRLVLVRASVCVCITFTKAYDER